MSDLADLLERATYDIEQGWPEAAIDAFGRAIRIVLEELIVRFDGHRAAVVPALDEHERRIVALEKRGVPNNALAELNEFRSSDAGRLDEHIRAILVRLGGWPSAKVVLHELKQESFHPLPKVGTVGRHLLKIRGKRSHAVEA